MQNICRKRVASTSLFTIFFVHSAYRKPWQCLVVCYGAAPLPGWPRLSAKLRRSSSLPRGYTVFQSIAEWLRSLTCTCRLAFTEFYFCYFKLSVKHLMPGYCRVFNVSSSEVVKLRLQLCSCFRPSPPCSAAYFGEIYPLLPFQRAFSGDVFADNKCKLRHP